MDFRHIRLEQSPAAVATVTLNRPDSLNALNAAMLDELRAAVESLADSGARCLLLAGEGRGFSSGADLASGGGLPDDVGAALEAHFNPLIEAVFALPIPIVAAVNGPCAGAGCSLALAADIVIAGASAYFLQAFINIGLIPDAGATWLLPRLAGRARAMEMMMLGERIPAQKAADWGLIARAADPHGRAGRRTHRPARSRPHRRLQIGCPRLPPKAPADLRRPLKQGQSLFSRKRGGPEANK
jgi:2-(1,2-epoxy-1,2-dihydrophenyl)acetyl-CoA isomerase